MSTSTTPATAPTAPKPSWKDRLTPPALRGYQRSWLRTDVIAGVTLAAVAIPETMGYTSIAQVPVVTGLYTVMFPAARVRPARVVPAAGGRRRLGDRGHPGRRLAGLGIAGLQPDSPQWLALTLADRAGLRRAC